jgi:hypothetical protein
MISRIQYHCPFVAMWKGVDFILVVRGQAWAHLLVWAEIFPLRACPGTRWSATGLCHKTSCIPHRKVGDPQTDHFALSGVRKVFLLVFISWFSGRCEKQPGIQRMLAPYWKQTLRQIPWPGPGNMLVLLSEMGQVLLWLHPTSGLLQEGPRCYSHEFP